jgi:hypothetical protein
MFFAVSRAPLGHYDTDQTEEALGTVKGGRVVLALLDISTRARESVARLEADVAFLIDKIQSTEASQSNRLNETKKALTHEVEVVTSRLLESEHTFEDLSHHWWVRIGRKLGLFPRRKD